MLVRQPSTNGTEHGAAQRETWGWRGSSQHFLEADPREFSRALANHHVALTGESPSGSQLDSWATEREVVHEALTELGRTADTWNLVFEFELPFEGGRRPDLVVLAGQSIL